MVLSDFNQPNNSGAGFVVGGEWMSERLGGSQFGFAVRGSYSYTGANDLDPLRGCQNVFAIDNRGFC